MKRKVGCCCIVRDQGWYGHKKPKGKYMSDYLIYKALIIGDKKIKIDKKYIHSGGIYRSNDYTIQAFLPVVKMVNLE